MFIRNAHTFSSSLKCKKVDRLLSHRNAAAAAVSVGTPINVHEDSSNGGAIIGGVVGGVVALLLLTAVIIVIAILWRRHKRRKYNVTMNDFCEMLEQNVPK